jgi:hypothetical protein
MFSIFLLFVPLLFILSKFFAAVVIAVTIKQNEDYENFIRGLKHHIYAILIVAAASYFVFGVAASFGLFFLGAVLFFFGSLDLEDTKSYYKELRKALLVEDL